MENNTAEITEDESEEETTTEDESEEETLQSVLKKFYKKLNHVERKFLYVYLIDMFGYTIIYITFLFLSGGISGNFITILIIIFPIISGITMVSFL